jgi:hypothetical protein
MDLETLFTEQKWNILKSLSEGKFSPLQLANKSNTTIANISQQLRLLEARDLVQKEKIPNRERGKPRTLFSLNENYAYIISVTAGFAGKRLLILNPFDKILLRILHVHDVQLHYFLVKALWKIDDYLNQIDLILFFSDKDVVEIFLSGEKAKDIAKRINSLQVKDHNGLELMIKFTGLTENELLRAVKMGRQPFSSCSSSNVLYDPQLVFSKLESHK